MPVTRTHRKRQFRRCPVCGFPLNRGKRFCSRKCRSESATSLSSPETVPHIPSPQEIAERAAAIRAEWTDEERLARFRVDGRESD